MIDYFKVKILEPSSVVRELDYYAQVSPKTGEIRCNSYTDPKGMFVTTTQKEEFEYGGIKFTKSTSNNNFSNGGITTSTYYYLEGSLHKHKNSGKYNFDRFTYSDFVEVMDEVCIQFNLVPSNLKLINLEFGFNIDLPIKAKGFISGIKTVKQKDYSITRFNDGGIMLEFHFHQYRIKLYDKGTQNKKLHNTPETLFRFEIHAGKAQILENMGVSSMIDLYKKDNWRALNEFLLKSFNQMVLFKGSPKGRTTKRESMISNMNNRDFWKDLNKDPFKRYKEHAKNSELNLFKHLKEEAYALMKKEFKQVLNSKEKHPRFYHFKEMQNTPVFIPSIEGKFKGLNANQCLISKSDISDQKKGSRFLSENKIGYKLAHDLRNAESNPRNNLKKRILKPVSKNQNSLFGVFDFLQLDNTQQEIIKGIRF